MKNTIYNYRKTLRLIGIVALTIGLLMAYFYWNIEPQESISGVFCGIGVSMIIIFSSLKKPNKT